MILDHNIRLYNICFSDIVLDASKILYVHVDEEEKDSILICLGGGEMIILEKEEARFFLDEISRRGIKLGEKLELIRQKYKPKKEKSDRLLD